MRATRMPAANLPTRLASPGVSSAIVERYAEVPRAPGSGPSRARASQARSKALRREPAARAAAGSSGRGARRGARSRWATPPRSRRARACGSRCRSTRPSRRSRTIPSTLSIKPYVREPTVSGERSSRDVRRGVDDDSEEQRDEQPDVVMERVVGERHVGGATRGDCGDGDDAADRGRALHERTGSDPLGPAMSNGSPDLLLERLEESGRQDEQDDPQPEDRGL